MSEIRIFEIHVTKDDIKLGCPEAVHTCPIARAVREATGCEWVHVTSNCELRFVHDTPPFWKAGSWLAELPDHAELWAMSFDEGVELEPIDFVLRFHHVESLEIPIDSVDARGWPFSETNRNEPDFSE